MSTIEQKGDLILSFLKVLILLQRVQQNGKLIVTCVCIGQNFYD